MPARGAAPAAALFGTMVKRKCFSPPPPSSVRPQEKNAESLAVGRGARGRLPADSLFGESLWLMG